MNLIGFEFGVMCSIWFWYDVDMMLIWFWYGFDMVWQRSTFFRVPDGSASKRKRKQPQDRRLVDSLRVFVVLICLIWFWYSFDTVCCDFEAVWIWFWHDSEMLPIYFQKKQTKPYKTWKETEITLLTHIKNHNFDPYQNHNWNHIKIRTAKPGQKQIITRNHQKHKRNRLKKLNPRGSRGFWCYKHIYIYLPQKHAPIRKCSKSGSNRHRPVSKYQRTTEERGSGKFVLHLFIWLLVGFQVLRHGLAIKLKLVAKDMTELQTVSASNSVMTFAIGFSSPALKSSSDSTAVPEFRCKGWLAHGKIL